MLAVGEAEGVVHVVCVPVVVSTAVAVIFHFQFESEADSVLCLRRAEAGIGFVAVAAYASGCDPLIDVAAMLIGCFAEFAASIFDGYESIIEITTAFIAVAGMIFYAMIAPELAVVVVGVYITKIVDVMNISASFAASVSISFVQTIITDVVFVAFAPVEVDLSLPGIAAFADQTVLGLGHFVSEMNFAAPAAFGCAIFAVGFAVDRDDVFGVNDAAAFCAGDDVGGFAVDGVDVLHCDLPFLSLVV